MTTFSVIVPTAGRPTLARTLASVAPQLDVGDELLVLRAECDWGNASRDSLLARAGGSHLLFIDDDDVYAEGALATMRGYVDSEPGEIHVFRMLYADGRVLWDAPYWAAGRVGTPMVVVPNDPGKIGRWENPHGQLSDFAFFAETYSLRAAEATTEILWHEEVVALVEPVEELVS